MHRRETRNLFRALEALDHVDLLHLEVRKHVDKQREQRRQDRRVDIGRRCRLPPEHHKVDLRRADKVDVQPVAHEAAEQDAEQREHDVLAIHVAENLAIVKASSLIVASSRWPLSDD